MTTRPDDTVSDALDVLHCPPDELAALLGVDLHQLGQVHDAPSSLPIGLRDRLVEVLLARAALLRRAACLLRPRASEPLTSALRTSARIRAAGDVLTPRWFFAEPTA
jgi:hypothetical protein